MTRAHFNLVISGDRHTQVSVLEEVRHLAQKFL